MIELVIHLLKSKRDPSGGRGWYRVERDGVVLVDRTREPLLDGSRVLLAHGVDAEADVGIRREGSSVVALSSRVGVAARLTVKEDGDGPRFVPVRDGPQSRPDGSPVAQSEQGGPTLHKASRTRPARSQPKTVGIVRDEDYPSMWRLWYVDGSVSDLVNFTRAKEAMRVAGLPFPVIASGPKKPAVRSIVREAVPIEPEPMLAARAAPVFSHAEDAVLSDWAPTATTIDPDFPEMPEFLRRV
jgi:hypothetical protein